MELTIEQIQVLKKEIEGIWTHLNNIETQLADKEKSTGKTFGQSAPKDSGKASGKSAPKDSGKAPGTSTDETIEMLERMKRKIDTREQEAEQTTPDDLDERIDQALINTKVREALERLKQQLGIG